MRDPATNKAMVWVRIDDKLHSHPKVLAAWEKDPASLGLYLLALSHAGAHLTDGMVDRQTVRQWLPNPIQRRRSVNALVKAGLWAPNGQGWEIHDFLDYNEPRDRVLARRHAREARKRGERGQSNDLH
jgi:hypothetical protein